MAFQFSTGTRNASLDAIETTVGTAPTLEIRSGAVPASAGAADSGTVLATASLPSDWLAAASAGAKVLAGDWDLVGAAAAGAGTAAGHFRIKAGATTHIQGAITGTGGGGDMILDNTSIAEDQAITITAFTITAGGA
jgi:hypothetical protein